MTQDTKPQPCIACGVQLDYAANHSSMQTVPYKGTLFQSYGHYGSTVYDPMDGTVIQVVVCDACLTAHADRVARPKPGGVGLLPWDPASG